MMNVRIKFDITAILKVFNKQYPDLDAKAIYKLPDGFLIFAPAFEDTTDYGDPYYFVDSKLSKATVFNMKYHKQMFQAFDNGELWKK